MRELRHLLFNWRIAVTLVLALGLTGLTIQSSVSQTGDVPASWECEIDPVGLLSLLQVMNELDEVSGTDTLQPIDAESIVPGEGVPAEDLEGIARTTRELAACVNARDVFRLAALFTPDFQARLVVNLIEGEELGALLEEIPVIADQVDRDQELEDIPIAAAWYSPFSTHEIDAILSPYVEGLEEQRQFIVRFVYSDGRWLIDEMRLISDDAGASPLPSPTAAAVASPIAGAGECWSQEELATAQATESMQFDAPPEMVIDQDATYLAAVETSMGSFTISMPAANAPLAVNNFVCLSRAGFYDGSSIFRVIEDFIIQTGFPAGPTGADAGYVFEDEPFVGEYIKGTVAMASAGPDTNSSQFFIVLDDLQEEITREYTIFGSVVEGIETVEAIAAVPVAENDEGEASTPIDEIFIERVTITETATASRGAVAASPVAAIATPEVIASPAGIGETIVSMDIFFEPDELTIVADTDVLVELPNEGAAGHNFSIDELSIDIDIDPGGSAEVVINAPAGEYEFYCNLPGHREAGMVGTLTVE